MMMFGIKSIARNSGRSVAKLSATSVVSRGICLGAFRQSLPVSLATSWKESSSNGNYKNTHSPVARNFSTDLSTVLANQIMEEDVELELDQELLDAQKLVLKNFAIKDAAGMGAVSLTRTYEDEKIAIEFDCQNIEEDFEENELDEDDEEQEEGEEEEPAMVTGINFEAKIHRGSSYLHIDLFAGNSLEVRNVRFVGEEQKGVDEIKLYSGPKFLDLDADLQQAFYEYLAARKIDDDLAFFVQTYSQDKEQKEYLRWLKKCLEFTSK